MRLHLRLDNKQTKDGLAYIFLDITHRYKRVFVSTKLTVLPKDWNKRAERVFPKSSNAEIINKALEKILADAYAVYAESIAKDLPFAPEMIRERMLGISKKNFVDDLQDVFNAYCESKRKNGVRSGSITVYRTMYKHLRGFEEASGKSLSFATMDAAFFDDFLAYLRTLGFVDNTIDKNIKTLKTFLNWAATKRNVSVNPAYKDKMSMRLKTESDHIALTEREVERIAALDTGDDTRFAKARDLFLLQCYTGLRYSDAVRLTEQHIKDGYIQITTIKTRQSLSIGLHPAIPAILARYDGKAPKLSNQRANEYLKEVCKRAGLTEDIRRVEFRGAERREVTQKKYDCIGTHTARRTFVTIAIRKGIPSEAIRKATGHKDLKSFDKYVRLTDESVAREFAEKWHDKLP